MKELKNGDIIVHAEDCRLVTSLSNYNTLTGWALIATALDQVDTYMVGEAPYCLGNTCCAMDFYNVRLERIYTVIDAMIDDLLQGKTIRLYAHVPTELDRQECEEWLFG